MDFYINGEIRYGIELLIRGSGLGEHQARFGAGGKYERLGVKQHLVVDCRPEVGGTTTNALRRGPNLMTMFFSDDFSRFRYVWDEDEAEIFLNA